GQHQVAEFTRIAQKGELVLAAPCSVATRFDFARVGEPEPRLAEEIEPDVGRRDVLLQHRPVADPFAQALREEQIAVGQAQQILEQWLGVVHRQICLTSSGIGKNVGWRYTLLDAGSNIGSFSPGELATMSADFTAQMLTPSLRRV